jgi:hypothetical protein
VADPTPDTARRFTKTVADLYGEATLAVLRQIADRMERGLDDTAQRAKLGDLLVLRRNAQDVAEALSLTLDDTLAQTISDAYDHGTGQATAHLAEAFGLRDVDNERTIARGLTNTKRSTVEGLAKGLGDTLRDLPLVRASEDAYRAAVVAATVPAAAGVETRRAATQRALDRLAMSGITGFTDKSGRRWSLDAYAEMATRSTLGQAALQGSVDRIRATTPFVRVSDVADECERCRPWEGKVLLTTDPSEIPEKWADVAYDGTLKDATSAGLFHPNCTHSVGAFIPGLTRRNTERPAGSNPKGYADRQKQRAMERHVRDWKRREAVALTPQSKALAAGKVQRWQQALLEHTARTNRPRRRDRESINRTRLPGDVPVTIPTTLPRVPDRPGPNDRTFDVDTAPPPPPPPPVVPVADMFDAELERELSDLNGAGDYGPRFEELAAELDRRDAERNKPAPKIPDGSSGIDELGVLRNAFGEDVAALRAVAKAETDQANERRGNGRIATDAELREEYDTWNYTQWLRAEEETRGNLLNRAGVRQGIDPESFFDGRAKPATIRAYATEELLRWFGANPRKSFAEFKAEITGGKTARKVRDRVKGRTLSEFG